MNKETAEKLDEVSRLLGVTGDMLKLSQAYSVEDQKLMHSRKWDDTNPDLITNKVKGILESVDPMDLTDDDCMWRSEILWFWYHHAISCALWKKRDKRLAQSYAQRALELQPPDNPNSITKLLCFLLNDQLEEAKAWMKKGTIEAERDTARYLIQRYERGEFFAPPSQT